MKPILALVLLAVLGFAVAGCGSGKKVSPATIEITGDSITVIGAAATIPGVQTGTPITCQGGPGAKVPPRGRRVSASAGKGTAAGSNTTGAPTGTIQVEHLINGFVRVTCGSR